MIRYKTVKKEGSAEQIIERSRFIAHVAPAETKEAADAFIAAIRTKHRDATHNVPAMVIGEHMEIQWGSDDGEPQGTSGAPMVQMLVKEGITNVVVVVTRYFGGVKLGTGGLVRAYTGSAKLGLAEAGLCAVKEMIALTVKLDYTWLAKLQNLQQIEGFFTIEDLAYTEVVTAVLAAEPEALPRLHALIANLTAGAGIILSEEARLVQAEL